MRVLFADDDVIARTLVAAVLADLDHEVTVTDDGAKAWAAFQAEPYPLVVLDINMPELDGLDVCRRIRAPATAATTWPTY
jgi:CheY-like chemotaxis protein